MKIQVQIKSIYGQEMCYPSCPQAHLFALIANTKTLSRTVLRQIAALGYDIEVIRVGSFETSILFHGSTDNKSLTI